MPTLANAKDEIFCQGVACGLNHSEAYRRATGRTKNADVLSARLLVKIGIKERIEELKAESSARCAFSRERYIQSLVEMYEASPEDASMTNKLCDTLVTRGQRFAVFPQKLAVGAQLSKLVGWDRPTEVRLEAGTELSAFLGGLFAQGGTLGSNNGGGGNGEGSKETSSPADIARR